MAYNTYYPQFYPSAQPTFQQPQVPHNNGITWVQGEVSAKSYPVGAGQSVLLMDSENPVMYIKSTDQSGMPLPLRIFDYKERPNNVAQPSTVAEPKVEYISRNEFDAFRDEIREELRQSNSKSTSSSVQTKSTVKEK